MSTQMNKGRYAAYWALEMAANPKEASLDLFDIFETDIRSSISQQINQILIKYASDSSKIIIANEIIQECMKIAIGQEE